MGPGNQRRAPVVSGAARNHLALWRIWLCALTTSLPSGVRPSASTAFSTSPKRAQRAGEDNYPPYNIERLGEDRYQISLAVAGFSPDEISITAEQNVVTIEGNKPEKAEREFLYRGISTRHFKRQFNLADYVQVKNASFDNGLLQDRTGPGNPRGHEAAADRHQRRIAERPSARSQGGLSEYSAAARPRCVGLPPTLV